MRAAETPSCMAELPAGLEGNDRRKRNPLVLVGAAATAGVLCAGLVAFRKGNQRLSQQMMRARIVAQGATVLMMTASSGAIVLGRKGD